MKRIIKGLLLIGLVIIITITVMNFPDWMAGEAGDTSVTVVQDSKQQSGTHSVRTYSDTLRILSSNTGCTTLFEAKNLNQLLEYDASFMKKLSDQLAQFVNIKGMDLFVSEKQLKKNFCTAEYYHIRDEYNGTNGLSLWGLSFARKGSKYKIGFDLEQEKIFYYKEYNPRKLTRWKNAEKQLIHQMGAGLAKYYGSEKTKKDISMDGNNNMLSGYQEIEYRNIAIQLILRFYRKKDTMPSDTFSIALGDFISIESISASSIYSAK